MRAKLINTAARSGRVPGFSLLEVVIALAIVSIALLALSRTGGSAPARYNDLQQRTLALWVADNALAELRLNEGFPLPGTRSGRENMAGLNWRWQAEISQSSEPSIRRVDVTVYLATSAAGASQQREQAVLSHTGFIGRP